MPTLGKQTPKAILVSLAGVANDTVVVYNRSTGVRSTIQIDSKGKSVYEIPNEDPEWSEGDVLEFRYNGSSYGSQTLTLNSATGIPQTVSITLTAESATLPAVNL